ncbi:MAG: hypothetical protein C0498_13390 [Anaerolinea sp.]|nr:hypothetical protein [Anaerolinea sp.]
MRSSRSERTETVGKATACVITAWRLLEVDFGGGAVPRWAMRLVTEWTDLHRHELLVNWRRVRAGLEPRRIPPGSLLNHR